MCGPNIWSFHAFFSTYFLNDFFHRFPKNEYSLDFETDIQMSVAHPTCVGSLNPILWFLLFTHHLCDYHIKFIKSSFLKSPVEISFTEWMRFVLFLEIEDSMFIFLSQNYFHFSIEYLTHFFLNWTTMMSLNKNPDFS